MSGFLMCKDGAGPAESQEAERALGIPGPLWLLADWGPAGGGASWLTRDGSSQRRDWEAGDQRACHGYADVLQLSNCVVLRPPPPRGGCQQSENYSVRGKGAMIRFHLCPSHEREL